jgi:alkanesulfonate monooxygenase SsuD/methylene tetrahydromethanopterin reductase-like flavin-dependent oxidoreductase (luciferase family)
METLDEEVQIIDLMLTRRPASFRGTHYSVRNAYNDPMPVQKPRPPIMIGGSGEHSTLRIVAKYADMCDVFGDPATVRHRYALSRGYCEDLGRPADEIVRSNFVDILIARDEGQLSAKRDRYPEFGGIIGTPETVVAALKEYAAAGSQYVTIHMPDAEEIEPLLLLGEKVVPAVADL